MLFSSGKISFRQNRPLGEKARRHLKMSISSQLSALHLNWPTKVRLPECCRSTARTTKNLVLGDPLPLPFWAKPPRICVTSAILSRAALMAEAFEAVDVNDEGFIRWEVRRGGKPHRTGVTGFPLY